MTNYILINAKTRAPVPLPYHTSDDEGPCRITDCRVRDEIHEVYVKGEDQSELDDWYLAADYGLALITEADFMAERSQ